MSENISPNPITLFTEWYLKAQSLGLTEPSAAVFVTSTTDGKPSARVLLLKHYDDNGFVFFTNLTSRKGRELHDNPNAAVCFYWDGLLRQVRIEGEAEQVSEKEADDYFSNRVRGSQIASWASKQSCVMQNSEDLAVRVQQIANQFEGQVIPRPPFWSGYRVIPDRIEFWQSGEFRLNTRIVYTRTKSGWKTERLYP